MLEIVTLVVAAMFIDMGKTGIPGAGMIAVPLIVIIFGSKESTGLVLPLLSLSS